MVLFAAGPVPPGAACAAATRAAGATQHACRVCAAHAAELVQLHCKPAGRVRRAAAWSSAAAAAAAAAAGAGAGHEQGTPAGACRCRQTTAPAAAGAEPTAARCAFRPHAAGRARNGVGRGGQPCGAGPHAATSAVPRSRAGSAAAIGAGACRQQLAACARGRLRGARGGCACAANAKNSLLPTARHLC